MSKLLLWLSFIATAVLFIFGIADPNSSVMWLASGATGYTILRAVMMVVLLGLIITEPPRNNLFRLVVGALSAGLAYWVIQATYVNTMQFLDSFVIMGFSICGAITVAELDVEKLSHVRARGLRKLTASLYAAYTVNHGKL